MSSGSSSGGGGLGQLAGLGSFLIDLFGANNSQNTNSSTSGTSTASGGSVTGTTNPAFLTALFGAATQALSNADNPAMTDNLVQNIFRQSKIAFAPVAETANSSGIYSGATLDTLKSQAQANAVGQAASSVLGYKVQEQNIAQGDLADLLAATRTVTQNETQTTKQNTQTQTSGNSGGILGSVICTHLYAQGKLTRAEYATVMRHFKSGVQFVIPGYFFFAIPAVQHMRARPESWLTKALTSIFLARTKNVVHECGVLSARWTYYGVLARTLVAIATLACTIPGWVVGYRPQRLSTQVRSVV